jgi:hypothetical protein
MVTCCITRDVTSDLKNVPLKKQGLVCGRTKKHRNVLFTLYPILHCEQPVMVRSDARCTRCLALFVLFILLSATCASAAPDTATSAPEPVVFLNMNTGSGQNVFDLSGNGMSGTIHGASRTPYGACGGALQFNGIDQYVAIPFSSKNHAEKALSVDLWFAIYSYDRQVLLSSYNDGGYRIAFDDGGDLWWTVRTDKGDISVPVQHEYIPPGQWHHVAGTYDGQTAKIYLDGILRNSVEGGGPVRYSYDNYVMAGVDAGEADVPDPQCNGYLKGGLDEILIYNRALTYGQIMDDRFRCTQEPQQLSYEKTPRVLPAGCSNLSAAFALQDGEKVVRKIISSGPEDRAVWNVHVPPGSTLRVQVRDAYPKVYPDSWYIEVGENGTRITRSIAFPNTINTPAEAVIPSGNATITMKYFDGVRRFPSSAYVEVSSTAPPPVIQESLNPIFSNPIIVIYTASWATLIAVIIVIFWLHKRNKGRAA